MRIPPYISKGAKIGIVAPAGVIKRQIILETERYLNDLGYNVVLGSHLFDDHFQFSSTDENRRQDFQQMLDDEDIDVILAARGGYGTGRVLESLDFSKFIEHPKWICGFSDITMIHSYLLNLSIPSIHSSMASGFTFNHPHPMNAKALIDLLEGKIPKYQGGAARTSQDGVGTGTFVGGNLSILYALRGTPFDIDPKGKILFIEEIGEYLYHIDRMLMNFKMSGWFDEIAGLVVGEFTDIKDHDLSFGKDLYELILAYVKDKNIPVLFDFPAGHGEVNYPLVMGQEVRLHVSKMDYLLEYL